MAVCMDLREFVQQLENRGELQRFRRALDIARVGNAQMFYGRDYEWWEQARIPPEYYD